MSKKKICVMALAATFVLGITVFAANGIISHWYGSSSSTPEYESLPTSEQCVEDAGYTPFLIEKFENGYVFDKGSVVTNSLTDDDDKAIESFKSFSFEYKKDSDLVIFSQNKFNSEMKNNGENIYSENNVDVYYTSYTNKFVPADYELTEEDKKAQAAGELVFSYGSDDISTSKVRGVNWTIGDIHYGLTQLDGSLTADSLLEMAKEIMAAKN